MLRLRMLCESLERAAAQAMRNELADLEAEQKAWQEATAEVENAHLKQSNDAMQKQMDKMRKALLFYRRKAAVAAERAARAQKEAAAQARLTPSSRAVRIYSLLFPLV